MKKNIKKFLDNIAKKPDSKVNEQYKAYEYNSSIINEKKADEEKQETERKILCDEIKAHKEELQALYAERREMIVKFDKIHKENEELRKTINEQGIINENGFVLCAGKYKGNIDIPIGCYNLKLLSGIGDVETNKPDNIYFRMTKDRLQHDKYGWTDKYMNLEVSEKTILKISESANIEFVISKKYDFSEEIKEEENKFITEKRKLEGEIFAIRNELKILNDDLIQKYYNFSNYDNITSQECKNQLIILKQREKELREAEEDVVVKVLSTMRKTPERAKRQVLRCFNMECDNIMFNVSLGNIDLSRKKLQNSYESLNKLYAIDGISLTPKILELKLEQITLMYTMELKAQQEREIQKAIREKMLDEAKAEKEIQEQKKRIEKDLQQHIGEVNKLMKYMQKAQLDVEKQMYIDRIKELEDKIKTLEADRETVLEREANAKAGFVYIISNIGSFGENIYKIGMTRRLEPMDRVKELSSASVPFEFDVHAMIFSSDAPELENLLHKHFADRAVNKVNPRKEFFNVDIDEIEEIVKKNYDNTVQFTKIPIAAEYRQSMYL